MAVTRKPKPKPRPGIGLALGGGGARGLAHVGVLRVLEREGIPITHIAGTSMGGLLGALYAGGVSLEAMEEELDRLDDFSALFRLFDLSIVGGLSVKGARIYEYLARLLGPELQFSDLRLPFAAVAVDLNTGREVILREGRVAEAVRASISIPGVFVPYSLDPHLMIDGGVLDNVPVDAARLLGVGPVAAVDVLPAYGGPAAGDSAEVAQLMPNLPLMRKETWATLMIMISALTEYRLRDNPPDVLIRPRIPPEVTLLTGFGRAKEIVASGERAAEEALPAIRALLGLR